jgi:hypothetical protein
VGAAKIGESQDFLKEVVDGDDGNEAGIAEQRETSGGDDGKARAVAVDPPLLAQVATLPAAKLAHDVTFAKWTQPAVTYLSLDMSHGIHHRGQLSAYLRPMGAKVPSIYGPSADEPLQAAATE